MLVFGFVGLWFIKVGADIQEWFLIIGGTAIATTAVFIGCRVFGAPPRVLQLLGGFCMVLFGVAFIILLIGFVLMWVGLALGGGFLIYSR